MGNGNVIERIALELIKLCRQLGCWPACGSGVGVAGEMTTPVCPSCAGYRFPAEVISYAVWLFSASRSGVADHDLAEMGAAFEMAICFDRLVEWEDPINDGSQPMQRQGPVHRFEISAAAAADRTKRHAASAKQQRVEHRAGSRQT
jgi:hypothetical protein